MERGEVVGLANHTALLARDGREYQIADSAAPIRNAAGDVVGVVLVFSDVTEKYAAQQALTRSAELLEYTGRLGKIGGWEVNLQSMKLSWTSETFRIAEIDSLVEPPLDEGINLFAPAARPIIAAAVQAATETGATYDLELPIITAKGRHLWVHTQGFAEMLNGKAVRLFGTFQDITEQKQAEEELKASEKRWKFAIEGAGDGLWD
jgi:PAS domain-containing protein